MQAWEREPVAGVGGAGRDVRGVLIALRVAELNEENMQKGGRWCSLSTAPCVHVLW